MSDIFNTTVIGRLTRDPEAAMSKEGKPWVKFSMAVNHSKREGDVSFVDCKAYGKMSELIEQYVGKGDRLLVNGRMKQERWEKDGVKHSKFAVHVSDISFITGKGKEEQPPGDQPAERMRPDPITPAAPSPEDQEVPF